MAREFAGLESVTYARLVDALRDLATDLEQAPAVRAAHADLLTATGLDAETLTLESFSRIRLAFEATRDGGLWGLRWDITDQMPRSDRIWQQWRAIEKPIDDGHGGFALPDEAPTAIAECDELSALFAIIARDLGVDGFVGLHWPTWNHVVAVWELTERAGRRARVLVPTSQVFLSREATLGTTELPTNRIVFPYVRRDIADDEEIPLPLARWLMMRARSDGARDSAQLQAWRNERGSS